MSPRSFLDGSKGALAGWADLPERLTIQREATIGVVLIGLGGPSTADDIEPYLYRLLMDPQRVRMRGVPRWLRERVAAFLARRRAPGLVAALQAIGGTAPELRLLDEQARSLESELNGLVEEADHLRFRTYVTTRYGSATAGEIIQRMRDDGVSHVVLVPACPIRLSAITDSCVAWWHMATREAEFDHIPTTVIWSHDASADFIQSACDRLDEAIQRFPRLLRDDVHLIFALHPGAALDSADGSPEKCPLMPLVERLRAHRSEHCHHVAYVQNWGLGRQPSPVLVEALEAVAATGGTGAVVVPIGFTTDTMETAYELDVALRGIGVAHELRQMEIASGLNCHALYLNALAAAVRARVQVLTRPGDGTLLPLPDPPDVVAAGRGTR